MLCANKLTQSEVLVPAWYVMYKHAYSVCSPWSSLVCHVQTSLLSLQSLYQLGMSCTNKLTQSAVLVPAWYVMYKQAYSVCSPWSSLVCHVQTSLLSLQSLVQLGMLCTNTLTQSAVLGPAWYVMYKHAYSVCSPWSSLVCYVQTSLLSLQSLVQLGMSCTNKLTQSAVLGTAWYVMYKQAYSVCSPWSSLVCHVQTSLLSLQSLVQLGMLCTNKLTQSAVLGPAWYVMYKQAYSVCSPCTSLVCHVQTSLLSLQSLVQLGMLCTNVNISVEIHYIFRSVRCKNCNETVLM